MAPRARVLAVLIVVLAAACGDDDGADDAGPTRDTGAALDTGPRPDGAAPDAPFGVDAGPTTGPRGGRVRLDGHILRDDGGPFVALGASLFWAAWGYKFDLPRLERNLQWLADHGFHYIRALGVVGDPVGPDSWDGREIDWRWEDYDAVIAGVTDLAWDRYGLRVQWTLIGDGQINIPDEADRYALADRFLAMSATRPEKVILFEVANEAWQNGFDGDAGNAQLRAIAQYLRDRTDILVAASAPFSTACDEIARVYGAPGEIADVATIHFDRDLGREEGNWGPVWQPWVLGDCGAWVGSNNEPIGPGSSVANEEDPTRLAASALSTWVSGLPFHVFHSRAGVRGFDEIMDMGGADAFQHVRELVPPELPGWTRRPPGDLDAPFVVYAEDASGTLVPDASWMDVAEPPRSGVVRAYAATRDTEFVVVPIGILGSVTLEARRALTYEAFDPVTGARVGGEELAAGARTTLSAPGGALVIRGSFR
jgi:hypothetical protein